MKDCIFCKIINGEMPGKILYEDDFVMVIMDIDPSSNGHSLIIPKKHINDFTEMDDETITHINKASKIMKDKLYKTFNPDGLHLHVNYGIHQVVKHYHMHVIPVYKNKQELMDVDDVYNKIMENN